MPLDAAQLVSIPSNLSFEECYNEEGYTAEHRLINDWRINYAV